MAHTLEEITGLVCVLPAVELKHEAREGENCASQADEENPPTGGQAQESDRC